MAAKLPTKARLYKIKEASNIWHVPVSVMYEEIRAGRLRAKMRRGNVRGYVVTEEVMDAWVAEGLVDVYETNFMPDREVLA